MHQWTSKNLELVDLKASNKNVGQLLNAPHFLLSASPKFVKSSSHLAHSLLFSIFLFTAVPSFYHLPHHCRLEFEELGEVMVVVYY